MRWVVELPAASGGTAATVTVDAESWAGALKTARGGVSVKRFRCEFGDEGMVRVSDLDTRERYTVRPYNPERSSPAIVAPPPSTDLASTNGASPTAQDSLAPPEARASVPDSPGVAAPEPRPSFPLANSEPPPAAEVVSVPAAPVESSLIARSPGLPPAAAETPALFMPTPSEGISSTPHAEPLPSPEVLFERDQDPDGVNPLTYRERVFAVPRGTSRTQAEQLARQALAAVRRTLASRSRGRYVAVAVFDHRFPSRPERPPLVVLKWKDWRGEPEVSFPPESPVAREPAPPPPAAVPEAPPQDAPLPRQSSLEAQPLPASAVDPSVGEGRDEVTVAEGAPPGHAEVIAAPPVAQPAPAPTRSAQESYDPLAPVTLGAPTQPIEPGVAAIPSARTSVPAADYDPLAPSSTPAHAEAPRSSGAPAARGFSVPAPSGYEPRAPGSTPAPARRSEPAPPAAAERSSRPPADDVGTRVSRVESVAPSVPSATPEPRVSAPVVVAAAPVAEAVPSVPDASRPSSAEAVGLAATQQAPATAEAVPAPLRVEDPAAQQTQPITVVAPAPGDTLSMEMTIPAPARPASAGEPAASAGSSPRDASAKGRGGRGRRGKRASKEPADVPAPRAAEPSPPDRAAAKPAHAPPATPAREHPADHAAGPRAQRRGDELLSDLFDALMDLAFLNEANEACEFTAKLVRDFFTTEAAAVLLYDIDRDELVVTAVEGVQTMTGRREKLTRGTRGQAVLKHKPVAVAQGGDPGGPIAGLPPGPALFVPAYHNQRLFGLIELHRVPGAAEFAVDEQDAASYVASQLGEFLSLHSKRVGFGQDGG